MEKLTKERALEMVEKIKVYMEKDRWDTDGFIHLSIDELFREFTESVANSSYTNMSEAIEIANIISSNKEEFDKFMRYD